LSAIEQGDPHAADQLLPLVWAYARVWLYAELHDASESESL
jgi:hypothetical protein